METNKHHMNPIARGCKGMPYNCLRIKVHRHKALHRLYGTMTWLEISRYLCLLMSTRAGKAHVKTKDYHTLWGNKSLTDVIILMGRVWIMKRKKHIRCQSYS